jgi:hypothetical protein
MQKTTNKSVVEFAPCGSSTRNSSSTRINSGSNSNSSYKSSSSGSNSSYPIVAVRTATAATELVVVAATAATLVVVVATAATLEAAAAATTATVVIVPTVGLKVTRIRMAFDTESPQPGLILSRMICETNLRPCKPTLSCSILTLFSCDAMVHFLCLNCTEISFSKYNSQ